MTCSICPPSALTKPSGSARFGDELDVLGQEAREHLFEIVRELAQVDDLGLQQLAAAERQELTGERPRRARRRPVSRAGHGRALVVGVGVARSSSP